MPQNRPLSRKMEDSKGPNDSQTGIEEDSGPSMYRPISLLNTEGKILGKLLIKRIMHHLYKTDALNGNQYGFTPQKNTVDAAMEVRQFIERHLERGGGNYS